MPGIRENLGKPRFSILQWRALMWVAKVTMFGATKYPLHNWRKGLSHTATVDSAIRHFAKWINGENVDEESGLPHLAHAAWNALTVLEHSITHPELDDRYGRTMKDDDGKPIAIFDKSDPCSPSGSPQEQAVSGVCRVCLRALRESERDAAAEPLP